jgi:hypothetical protein
MKYLFLALLLAGLASVNTGCATPAYSGGLPSAKFPEERFTGEHSNMYARNWMFEFKQMSDDWDSILLLDPVGRLSKWNLR